MSEINIILIRHGEAAQSWGDHPDPDLSEDGFKQAKHLEEHSELQNLHLYDFISSPKARAKSTAVPLAKKFNKEIVINGAFSEIPSGNIDANEKKQWLTKTMKEDIKNLSEEVAEWRIKLLSEVFGMRNDTIIFSHFMVINALVGELAKHPNLLHFYPDYTSITKINLEDGAPKSFSIEGSKKTIINL